MHFLTYADTCKMGTNCSKLRSPRLNRYHRQERFLAPDIVTNPWMASAPVFSSNTRCSRACGPSIYPSHACLLLSVAPLPPSFPPSPSHLLSSSSLSSLLPPSTPLLLPAPPPPLLQLDHRVKRFPCYLPRFERAVQPFLLPARHGECLS